VDVQQLLARLKKSAASLTTSQLVSLALAFVAVVGVTIGSAYWLNTPNYGVLFSDMDAESASAVVTKLKNEKIAYVLDDGGKTIRVPTTKVDELRLDLASQGMPASGRIGFEIFDRTAFGVTDFLEHVNYRRALEGELARTISSIGEVAGARVHIAMAKQTLFAGQDQPAKASVVLKLKNNRPLAPTTVNAITGLVAASVESLRPESVVVIDNYGRSLARPNETSDESATSGMNVERQQRLEHEMSTRVVALLDPILGPGHVRVNVAAKLDGGSQEETEERWDPQAPVVRSRQSVNQSSGGAGAQGVAGARSNLPAETKNAQAEGMAPVPGTGSAHTAETVNYEVSRVTRHRIQPRGELARLSVAVVVDDDHVVANEGGKAVRSTKPRAPGDIQKIHDIVAAAVGLDTDRGDQLTVENIAFEETPVEEPPVVTTWQKVRPQVFDGARMLSVLLIAVLALFGVIKPAIAKLTTRGVSTPAMAIAGGAGTVPVGGTARTIEELESEIEAELQAAANMGTARRLPVLTRRVAAMTQKEPENAARLLRTWLTEDDR